MTPVTSRSPITDRLPILRWMPLSLLSVTLAGGNGEVFAARPWAAPDSEIRVTAGGRPVEVARLALSRPSAPDSVEALWVRVTSDAAVDIAVTLAGSLISTATLRGIGTNQPVETAGETARGTLPGPGQYCLSLRPDKAAGFNVFFFVEAAPVPPWAPADDGEVIDVAARGVTGGGAVNHTGKIQALLDECAARPGGGVVHFPTGVWRTGPLRIGSRTTVHLAAGAVLKAADDPFLFESEFLLVDNARGVRLCGAGVIDGNGALLRARRPELTHRLHGLVVRDSENVRVEGLVFRDCVDWNLHIHRSAGVEVRGVRLFAHKDGFAVDSSRDVLIEDCFAVSTDDTALVCARDNRSAERVIVRRCMFSSAAVALKIGSLTAAPIRNVLFEECEVVDSNRAMAIETRHPVGAVERVVWRSIRAELAMDSEGEGGALLQIRSVEGGGDLRLRDCAIEQVRATVMAPSLLAGSPTAPLSGLRLADLEIACAPPGDGSHPAIFEMRHVAGIEVSNLAVRWLGQASPWTGVLRGDGMFVVTP